MGIYNRVNSSSNSTSHKHNESNRLHTELTISRLVALIDIKINNQLNTIIHEPRFQQLESSWRGVKQLTDAANMLEKIRIRLFDISWKELSRDIERASYIEQCRLFELVYSEEFDSPGGEPYTILLGDYSVSHQPSKEHPYDDIHTLQGISQVAAAAFSPFICGASPKLFGLNTFDTLEASINLTQIFEQPEYLRWRAMRERDDTRFIGVTLPGILMRKPYRTQFSEYRGLRFKEDCNGPTSKNYLWGNASYAFGTVLIRAFIDIGWFSHLRGSPRDEEAGGLVSQFPVSFHETDSTPTVNKPLTPVVITDYTERELSDLGFLSLCHAQNTPYAIFQNCVSLQHVKDMGRKSLNANARISAMLQQILCASRFAQYIKVMIRDKVGAYIGPRDCERQIQQWLNKYSTGRDDLDWDTKARYPLRDSRVKVVEEPGKPGSYQSIIHLRTHYTADNLISELKLTTALTQIGNGNP
ncbi:MAG: type VI secretion system protein ImpD [Flavobacteriales bacterium]